MGSEDESSVLATRVLAYLKRKSGKGQPPSAAEEKAAAAALQLLNNRYPGIASDPAKAVENLARLARKGATAPDPKEFGDLSNPTNAAKYRKALVGFQLAMDQLMNMYRMMSDIKKAQHDSLKSITQNIRG